MAPGQPLTRTREGVGPSSSVSSARRQDHAPAACPCGRVHAHAAKSRPGFSPLASGFATAHACPRLSPWPARPPVASSQAACTPRTAHVLTGRLGVSEATSIGSLGFHRAHAYISQALRTSPPVLHLSASPSPASPLHELQSIEVLKVKLRPWPHRLLAPRPHQRASGLIFLSL